MAYICSRFYRAPELIFGSTDYSTMIDVWSQGCVFAELLIGTPIFPGSSGVDQLVEIIKVRFWRLPLSVALYVLPLCFECSLAAFPLLLPHSTLFFFLLVNAQVLGTPTKDELKSMNPNYQEFKFPQIRAYPWGSIFKPSTPPESIDLIGKLLAYVPDKRLKSIEVRMLCSKHGLFT